MSHFAHIKDGIVDNVIVAEQEYIDTFEDKNEWIQTSYNTRGGIHYAPNSNEPDGGVPLRKNYAGVGMIYDSVRDAFYPVSPYTKWVLNEDSCLWEAPVPYPMDGKDYYWDDEKGTWEEEPV